MKTKRFFLFGLPVLLLALGLALAGCGGDDDGDGGGDGLNLPGIDEPTTGRETIKSPDGGISLTGLPSSLEEKTDSTGATFSVKGGKFSFELPKSPNNQNTLANNSSLRSTLFNDSQATDYTTTAEEATFASVTRFSWSTGDTSYSINRRASETDEKTYEYSSEIVYIYVSENVTLSRAAKTSTDSQVDAVNLALKAGWNLVQKDRRYTVSGSTGTEKITVKIADKNVPWTLRVHTSSGSSGNN
jgi:hypothetical protein